MITSETTSSDPDTAAELVAMVDELVGDLSVKFTGVSTEIFRKMDDMARRLDALEAVLTEAETSTSAPGAIDADVPSAPSPVGGSAAALAAAAAVPMPGTPVPAE